MADVSVPSIQSVTPAASDSVLGVKDGAVKRFVASDLITAITGFTQAGSGAVARTVQDKAREWVTPQDFMTSAQKSDVAARTRLVDVSDAIVAAFAAHKNIMFPPGDYKVTMVEGTPLVSLTSQSNINVIGFGAVIYDPKAYTTDPISAIFHLDGCSKVKFIGVDYVGVTLASPSHATQGIGYLGATFVNLKNGCTDVEVDANLTDLRYGVRSGSYATPGDGYNKRINTKLRTLRCGYPIAHYLAEDVDADISAESTHRAAYLAGVKGFRVNARFKNQYIAAVQVLVTDAKTGAGTSDGSSAGKVWARDMGSTTFVANSYCAGISLSRVDPGTIFKDIEFHVHAVGTDTVATTMGGFIINSTAKSVEPSYANNWESTIYLKGIKVSGLVDRSAQTAATHGVGEIYIHTQDTNYATVTSLDLEDLLIINGSGSNPRDLYCIVPGLTDRVNVKGCHFGNYTLEFNSTTTAPFNFIDCSPITRTAASSGETSALNFINTDVTSADQPVTNATFTNAKRQGAGVRHRTKIINSGTLSGASVTLSSAIPASCVVLGITGKITTTITGASGYQVGPSGDLTRYGDRNDTASGTAMPAISASTETSPRNYAASTDLVLTAKTSNFTGGALRLAIHYLDFSALT